jgi:hypothetical protein
MDNLIPLWINLSQKLSIDLLNLQPQMSNFYFRISSTPFFYKIADAENLRQAAVPVEVGGAGRK